jgi:hypothetical protein
MHPPPRPVKRKCRSRIHLASCSVVCRIHGKKGPASGRSNATRRRQQQLDGIHLILWHISPLDLRLSLTLSVALSAAPPLLAAAEELGLGSRRAWWWWRRTPLATGSGSSSRPPVSHPLPPLRGAPMHDTSRKQGAIAHTFVWILSSDGPWSRAAQVLAVHGGGAGRP